MVAGVSEPGSFRACKGLGDRTFRTIKDRVIKCSLPEAELLKGNSSYYYVLIPTNPLLRKAPHGVVSCSQMYKTSFGLKAVSDPIAANAIVVGRPRLRAVPSTRSSTALAGQPFWSHRSMPREPSMSKLVAAPRPTWLRH